MKSVKDPRDKLARGELSRRGFLEATTATGISAALVPGLIEEAEAAPRKGGTLRQALPGGGTGDVLDVFELAGGNADFPFLMSDYHLCICPAQAEGGIDWESGVGSGGY